MPLPQRHSQRRPQLEKRRRQQGHAHQRPDDHRQDTYLQQAIANPDAQIVKGYRAGVMSAAVASFNLASQPDEIRALVAFINSQK